MDDFDEKTRNKLRPKSRAKYENALRGFQSRTKKAHITQADRADISGYVDHLVTKQGLEVRTATWALTLRMRLTARSIKPEK